MQPFRLVVGGKLDEYNMSNYHQDSLLTGCFHGKCTTFDLDTMSYLEAEMLGISMSYDVSSCSRAATGPQYTPDWAYGGKDPELERHYRRRPYVRCHSVKVSFANETIPVSVHLRSYMSPRDRTDFELNCCKSSH